MRIATFLLALSALAFPPSAIAHTGSGLPLDLPSESPMPEFPAGQLDLLLPPAQPYQAVLLVAAS